MNLYRYKALSTDGDVLKGSLSAPDLPQLEWILKKQGKELISATKAFRLKELRKQATPNDLVEFFIQFKSLHQAKFPLLEILSSIQEDLRPSTLKQALEETLIGLDSGTPLSECLRAHAPLFDQVTLSLLQIGEETGKMSQSLEAIINHLKWQQDFKAKSKKALTYPLCLVCVIIGVVSLLFVTLVPQLTTFFQTMEIDMPFVTRALISFSRFMGSSWEIIGAILGSLITGIVLSRFLSQTIRKFWDRLLLKLPFWGHLKHSISLMRYFHVLWILLDAHVELLKSLKTAQQILKNKGLQDHFDAVYGSIQQGKTLSQALQDQECIPPLAIRMLKTGEQSGDLVGSLHHVNYFFEREVEQKTTRFLKLLEPSLVLILGSMVAWIALAIFYPLYDSLSLLEV